MNKLIIDVANEKIFLLIITSNNIYNITHENTKINYEKLTLIITDFLNSWSLKISDINKIYINRGPGSFAGIRNSLSIVKAMHLSKKIDFYSFSYKDFLDQGNKYISSNNSDKIYDFKNLPDLCDKFNIKKNLIKPLY